MKPEPLSISVPVIPDHELICCVGRGSYGEVWLARNVVGTYRAVKVVYRSSFDDKRPYEREYEGIQKFEPVSRTHEGLIDILQIGRNDSEGYFYYVMELADDASPLNPNPNSNLNLNPSYLPQTLRSEAKRRGRLPVNECVQIGLALASALEHLHKHRLVHRDIKPSNIIFVNGIAKLADIGLVTSVDASRSYVGTEGFVPPEGPGTPQADLYSLGKVLYEISTGKDRSAFPEPLTRLRDEPQLLELNAIIHKACECDARGRYQSAGEMAAELAILRDGGSVQRARKAAQRRSILKTAAALLLGGAALFAAGKSLIFKDAGPRQLAILRPVVDSAQSQHRYLGDVLAENILDAFSSVRGSRTVPYRDSRATAATNAHLLNTRAVAIATLTKSTNYLKFELRLVDARKGHELWSGTFDGQNADLPVIGVWAARQLAQALDVTIPETALTVLQTNLSRSLEAYRLYGEARKKPRNTKAGLYHNIDFLNQAIVQDPNFATAYGYLAQVYFEAGELLGPPRQMLMEARKNAQRALELDDTLAEAHAALGGVLLAFEWNAAEAELHYRRALELNPRSMIAHGYYAIMLSALGRFEEADPIVNRGLQIDPKSQVVLGARCWRHYLSGRFEELLQTAQNILSLHTNDLAGVMQTAFAYERLGNFTEALKWTQRMIELDAAPDCISFLGFLHGRMGNRDQALGVLEELQTTARTRYVSDAQVALVHVGLGDHDKALEHLERALEQRSGMLGLLHEPRLEPLRSDPRFAALVQKVGLRK